MEDLPEEQTVTADRPVHSVHPAHPVRQDHPAHPAHPVHLQGTVAVEEGPVAEELEDVNK